METTSNRPQNLKSHQHADLVKRLSISTAHSRANSKSQQTEQLMYSAHDRDVKNAEAEDKSALDDKGVLNPLMKQPKAYGLANRIFLRLQDHFPPESLRRASCSLCPCTFQLLSDQIHLVRTHALMLLSTKDAGTSEHIALVCGVFFFLHRLYLAFHRPSIPHPPLTRGDATAGEAHSHRITLLSMAQRMDAEIKRRDMVHAERKKHHGSRSRPASPGFGPPPSVYEEAKSPPGFRILSAVASPTHSRPASPFAHFEDEAGDTDTGRMDMSLTTEALLDLLLQSAHDTMAQQSKSIVRDLLLSCCENGNRFLTPKLGGKWDGDKVDWTHPTLSDFLDTVRRLVMVVFTLKEEVKIGPNTAKSLAPAQTPGATQANSRASSRPASPVLGRRPESVRSSRGEKPGIPRPAWGMSFSAKVRQHQEREKKRTEASNEVRVAANPSKFPRPKDRAKPKEPEQRWMP